MHERVKHQDVDEDHGVEPVDPEAWVDALAAPALRVRGEREQQDQDDGDDADEREIAGAEKAVELRQQRRVSDDVRRVRAAEEPSGDFTSTWSNSMQAS